jgi:hypothetical protein
MTKGSGLLKDAASSTCQWACRNAEIPLEKEHDRAHMKGEETRSTIGLQHDAGGHARRLNVALGAISQTSLPPATCTDVSSTCVPGPADGTGLV